MTAVRNLLLAGAALSVLANPGAAFASEWRPLLLAQAETPAAGEVVKDAVTLAEEAVEEARAALRAAMATGRGVAEARQKLRDALKALEEARAAAGLPPAEDTEELPPAQETTPPAEGVVPPAEETVPPPEEVVPPSEEPAPPAMEEVTPPAEQPPMIEETPPPPTEQPPVIEETPPPPAEPPAVEEQVQPPAVEQVPPPPVEEQQPPAAPQETVTPPAEATATVDAVAPTPIELPPPMVEEPPPPPPPAALEGPFDLQKFSARPAFGAESPAAAPPPALPATAEVVKEGAVLPAPDGRVIVKNQGQVTVVHDDTGRFLQQGDRVETQQSANQTTTTTVQRPDGSEIVTVRDRWGNVIQRYRKKANGSVEILIGDMQQPGLVGRIFGRGAQPAPPPPPRPPAPINLQFGPLVLNIPQQQYVVEMSRANQQQIEQALIAPPVETVERAYTLEEIQRNGRLRDKVRRIDLDAITFNTNQATVPDDQIVKMQSIGMALRNVIQQDPTQVFLIEGHTDAVGSDLYNLALSDRRAETIAQILSYYFGIPAENLVTQGYGEQYLKIPTVAAERQNRRVAFRNITYLLRAGG
jgi:outer membrane protein OmpA-like peptidoglycan-associated protein